MSQLKSEVVVDNEGRSINGRENRKIDKTIEENFFNHSHVFPPEREEDTAGSGAGHIGPVAMVGSAADRYNHKEVVAGYIDRDGVDIAPTLDLSDGYDWWMGQRNKIQDDRCLCIRVYRLQEAPFQC